MADERADAARHEPVHLDGPDAVTEVAHFVVRHERFIDEDGVPHGDLPSFAADRDALVDLYRGMVETRVFDEKAIALQRTGRLGTYASSLGQEAIGVGVAAAMASDDVLVPSFREQGAQLWRGVRPEELLLFWGGDERGSDFAGPREDFPVSIPVASHALHSAGVALAFALRREARAAVCMLGDGATSKGDFYEAINVAGVWDLPLVLVVANNGWAISMPRRSQTAAGTLAQKAIAAGIEGLQVDGNDVVAVRHVAGEALARARADGGPALIEALTYRLADHTTADDASRYRAGVEVEEHRRREPLARMRAHLAARHGWSEDDERALVETCHRRMDEAVEAYLATAPQAPESMFDHLYERLPTALEGQRASLAARGAPDD